MLVCHSEARRANSFVKTPKQFNEPLQHLLNAKGAVCGTFPKTVNDLLGMDGQLNVSHLTAPTDRSSTNHRCEGHQPCKILRNGGRRPKVEIPQPELVFAIQWGWLPVRSPQTLPALSPIMISLHAATSNCISIGPTSSGDEALCFHTIFLYHAPLFVR